MNYIDISNKIKQDYTKNSKSIDNSIKNILMTRRNSLPGNPEFGSNLYNYLFEEIDPLVTQLIKEEVNYSLIRWEPRIIIKEISIIEDPDYNRLGIKINYIIKQEINNPERDYILNFNK